MCWHKTYRVVYARLVRTASYGLHSMPCSRRTSKQFTRHISETSLRYDIAKSGIDDTSTALIIQLQLDTLVALTLRKFADESTREDIQKFFKDRDNSGYDRTLRIVDDTVSPSPSQGLFCREYITDGLQIAGNSRYVKREAAGVQEWLSEHGYA